MELQEPLNRAHRVQRQAERDILSGRFTDALLHFQLAAEYYGKTVADLPTSSSSLSLQILLEQKKFCLHQVEILCLKLKQLETLKRNHEAEINRSPILISNLDIEHKRGGFYNNGEKSMTGKRQQQNMAENNCLKTTILQKLDQHDTLLDDLLLKNKKRDDDENAAENGKFNKQPKVERHVIEELQQLNDELRGFIVRLLEELETKNREIEMLKSERDNLRRSSSSIPTVIVGPDIEPITTVGDLPELAPLEIPSYIAGAETHS